VLRQNYSVWIYRNFCCCFLCSTLDLGLWIPTFHLQWTNPIGELGLGWFFTQSKVGVGQVQFWHRTTTRVELDLVYIHWETNAKMTWHVKMMCVASMKWMRFFLL
jgi:hypothetical protein